MFRAAAEACSSKLKLTNYPSLGMKVENGENLYSDDLRQAKHGNLLHKTNRLKVYGVIIAVYFEVKVAFNLEQVLKVQRWSRVIALLFL
jgi:hypothetical protein